MRELKRLVRIIAENNPKVTPLVGQAGDTSLEGRLYHIIKCNENLTDEEACEVLYGEAKLRPSYRMLKSRLRKKLFNSLLFIELNEVHSKKSSKLRSECFLHIHQANKLIELGEPFLAEKLADQIIGIAEEAELNDMLAYAYEIKQNADLMSHNRSKFENSLKLLQHYYFLDMKEREALVLFNQLKFELNINISNRRKQLAAYYECSLKLKKLWKDTGSSKIFNSYYLIQLGYNELSGDYEGILKTIEEAEVLLAKGIINKVWFNHRYNNYIKVYACLRLGNIEEGLNYSNLYLNTFKEGTINWFAFLENYLMLALHKKDYELAATLCKLAVHHGAPKNLVPGAKERWDMFLRYTQLLLPEDIKGDRIVYLLHEYDTSIISNDKEGLNLPLIILEYLEKLPGLDAEDKLQYVARFSKYATKYLKGEIWARARQFLKLLLLSMKEEGEKLEKKAGPFLQELKNTPPPRDPVAEVEVVPYEHLWELVLQLSHKRVKN